MRLIKPPQGHSERASRHQVVNIGLRRASHADGVGEADRQTEGDAGARVTKAQRQRSAGSSSRFCKERTSALMNSHFELCQVAVIPQRLLGDVSGRPPIQTREKRASA
jgi:hypothetical protein